MTIPSPAGLSHRSWPGGGILRIGRRTVAESLYLLLAPALAALGLVTAVVGVGARLLGPAFPGSARLASLDERWIAKPRGPRGPRGSQPGWQPTSRSATSRLTYAVLLPPVALFTAVVTVIWWFVAIGASTSTLRGGFRESGPLPPLTLNAGGSTHSHIDVSLGLTSPAERLTFATLLGLLLLVTLPLMTRACIAVHVALWRFTTRAREVTTAPPETSALHRLERDIHDGPQQRLVRLALELGRAQHHLGKQARDCARSPG